MKFKIMSPIKFDPAGGITSIELKETEQTLEMLWQEFLSDKDVVVFLSGGLDSQFVCSVAKKYARSIKAHTFMFLWDDNVINASDVMMSQRFCTSNDIPLTVTEFDVKRFYETELFTVAKKYKTNSPQIATHLAAMAEVIDDTYFYLVGGEALLYTIGCTDVIANHRSADKIGIMHSLVVEPYNNLANDLDCNLHKDLFLLTPETLYLAFKKNINVIKKNNIIFDMSYSLQSNPIKYKESYYNSFGYTLMLPLEKATGFEMLRYHFASETGNFDEFNDRYRNPLKGNVEKPKITKFIGYPTKNFLEEIDKIILDQEPKICNIYKFDW